MIVASRLASHRSRVYFAQDEHGYVKIGWSNNVRNWISALQVGCPYAIFLIREIDGGEATEAWLHRKFGALRVRGEWFRFDPQMMAVVPPDEVPVRQKVTSRRDIRLTIKEHLVSVDDLLDGASAGEKLFLLCGQLTEEQRSEVLDCIRNHVGLSLCEAA